MSISSFALFVDDYFIHNSHIVLMNNEFYYSAHWHYVHLNNIFYTTKYMFLSPIWASRTEQTWYINRAGFLPTETLSYKNLRPFSKKIFILGLIVKKKWYTSHSKSSTPHPGVRSVQEMLTLFSLCSGTSILGTHLGDSLPVPKISVNNVLLFGWGLEFFEWLSCVCVCVYVCVCVSVYK